MIEIFLGVKREGRIPDVVVVNKNVAYRELYAYHFVIVKKDGAYRVFKDRFQRHNNVRIMSRVQAFSLFREVLSDVRGTSSRSL